MVRLLILTLSIIATPALAKRKHKAHSHGVTTLDIVVTSKTAAMDFRGPSESLFGFEHTPKSDADKKTVKEQLDKLNTKSAELVKFPADRSCKTTVKEVETFVEEGHQHDHGHDKKKKDDNDHGHDHKHDKNEKDDHDHHGGEHSEFHIQFAVSCEQNIAGSDLTFGFSEVFPRVKSVKVQVLTETGQFGKTVKDKADKIRI